MKTIVKAFSIFLLLFLNISMAFALEDYFHFNSTREEARFNHLTSELRCLVCQNQNLAESNAGLANDLRQEIYALILKGQSDTDIIHYLVARYGDFILYKPPMKGSTLALWFGPFIILLSGLIYLIRYIYQNKNLPATSRENI